MQTGRTLGSTTEPETEGIAGVPHRRAAAVRRRPAEVITLAAAVAFLASSARALAQERPTDPPRAQGPQEKPSGGKSDDPFDGLYAELLPEFDTGKFGAKRRSDYLYVPFSLGYDLDRVLDSNDRLSALVTLPWEYQRSQGNVVSVGGRLVRTSRSSSRSFKSESGLGDLLVDGAYMFFKQDKDRSLPSLTFDAEVKIPTADDERGL
ncbi:MAG TPA: hypothetical protein VEN81_15655, partial [Planctomycetota bacterium]|nr:hypothetical protein [Planctomycetota bacterium]